MKNQILIPILLLLCTSTLFSQEVAVPDLKTRVTDLASILSTNELQALEQKLTAFEEQKGSQIAILTLSTTGDETIEQYAIKVAENWKIGRSSVDDGIILLVAIDDRKIQIEVGYGLEGAVTDALSKRIITNVITPEFRSGHFYKGINSAVDVLISAVSGEELPPAVNTRSSASGNSQNPAVKIKGFYIFFIIGMMFLHTFIKKKTNGKKASIVSFVIILIIGWFMFNLVVAVLASVVGTLILSANAGRGGGGGFYGGGGYYGGSGRGGFSGGGGGFGGFSGGGGGFGGGGASGGW